MPVKRYFDLLSFSAFIFILIISSLQSVQAQWIRQFGGTTEKLTDVTMLDYTTAIVVGGNGSILKTTDSGKSWRNTSPAVNCNCILSWNKVLFFNKLNGIVAGKSAAIITYDGGEQWSFLNLPAGHEYICIGDTKPGNLYVGDDSGYVFNSVDSGKTWTSERITTSPIRSIFTQPESITADVSLYALASNLLFIKTLPSDLTWNEMSLGYFQGLGSEAFQAGFSEDGTIFIVGVQGDKYSLATIIRLRMQDSRWYSVGPANEQGTLLGLSAPSSTIIYTSGTNGMILKSTNGGNNWFPLDTHTFQTLNSIYFIDNVNGFAVGDSGAIFYTSNGGISQPGNPPSSFHLLSPVNEDTMFLPRSISFIWQNAVDPDNDTVRYTLLISSDTCTTWNSFGYVTDSILQVQSPVQSDGRYYWTVIANDGMLATPSLDVFAFNIRSASNTDAKNSKVPGIYALSQNYPNPFNPSTKIRYDIPKEGKVTLKIFDVLGREVVTLIDAYQKPGRYEVEWNAENYASGVYIYSFKTENYYSNKKLVLLK